MLGFSTAARKLAPRDSFIGWTPQLREKNLPLVIDNPRFLILPWITIPNLGSHILSLVRRQLPDDWTERYNTTPVLIETFVETPRFTGALYKASGWTPRRDHQGTGPIRPTHQTGPAEEGHLAPTPAEGLAAHSQPVRSWSSVSPCGPPSRRDRTKTINGAGVGYTGHPVRRRKKNFTSCCQGVDSRDQLIFGNLHNSISHCFYVEIFMRNLHTDFSNAGHESS